VTVRAAVVGVEGFRVKVRLATRRGEEREAFESFNIEIFTLDPRP